MERFYKNASKKSVDDDLTKSSDNGLSLFQSRIANALLDYIEYSNDEDVVQKLKKSKVFFSSLGTQIDQAVPEQIEVSYLENAEFECAEDFSKINNIFVTSPLIH